jgi:hypothetical protein
MQRNFRPVNLEVRTMRKDSRLCSRPECWNKVDASELVVDSRQVVRVYCSRECRERTESLIDREKVTGNFPRYFQGREVG